MEKSMRGSWATLGIVMLVCLVAGSEAVLGYAGELGSGDGPVAQYAGLAVSTHHLHLTRALAYCAGLPARTDVRNPINPLLSHSDAQLAEVLAINDELTDQGTIGQAPGPVWTNINTQDWSYQLPSGQDVGCVGAIDQTMVFPILQQQGMPPGAPQPFWNPSSGWFTHRFGPWAGQFHFPQDDALADDLATMRAFAYAEVDALNIRSLYGFGKTDANTWSGSCYDQRLETVPTGPMTPGSLAAFATYLHSLGDSYSHRMCREHWSERQTPPWYYHTPPQSLQATCAFNDHSFEFGCPDTRRRAGFLEGTVDGAIAVYGELVGYAYAQGLTPRVASVDAHFGWLRRQIERYAMSFRNNFDQAAGACRVSFTYALMLACGAIDPGQGNACLPDVQVTDGGACQASGMTEGCPEGTEHFPMTPMCVGPQTEEASTL